MTMEFFILPFATKLAHQTPNKGCNAKIECTVCKSVEIWSSEYIATLTVEFIRVAKLMETNWAYRNAPKHGNWTTDYQPAGCAHFLSMLCRKAITAMDICNIRPTIKNWIIKEILWGIYVLFIHANHDTKVWVKRVMELGLQKWKGWEYTLIFHTSDHVDQHYFCELQILWEPMWKHPRSRYGAPYSSDKVDVIRRFHGDMGVILHRDLEVTLLGINEAKPITLKRPSPGDGFEKHMCHTKTRGNMECNLHLNELPTYSRSWCFINASLLNR